MKKMPKIKIVEFENLFLFKLTIFFLGGFDLEIFAVKVVFSNFKTIDVLCGPPFTSVFMHFLHP